MTFRTKAAADVMTRMTQERPDFLVGAGTVLDLDSLAAARHSGAKFGLAPGFDPAIVDEALASGWAFAPGIMTPSEVSAALRRGVKLMKFFPAGTIGGPAALDGISAPFAHLGLQFIPTGGVTEGNLGEWLKLKSVVAVGGTWIARTGRHPRRPLGRHHPQGQGGRRGREAGRDRSRRSAQPVLALDIGGREPAGTVVDAGSRRHHQGQNDLVASWRIGDPDLDGIEVAAHIGCVDMGDRHVEPRAEAADLLGRRHDGLGRRPAVRASRSRRAHATSAPVLDFAGLAHDGALAVAFDHAGIAAERRDQPMRHVEAERLQTFP